MSGAIYMGTSGAIVQQLRLEILANNLANINTSGFKKDLAAYGATDVDTGVPLGTGISVAGDGGLGLPVLPLSVEIDFSQGSLKTTGNPLDIALSGDGFFSVETPGGIEYTRQGSFSLNSDGRLVTQDGLPVLGESGPIMIEGDRISLDGDGSIVVDGDEVDRLRIVDFEKPYRLRRTEGARFAVDGPDQGGSLPENTTVVQGSVEVSNIEAITAMTEMIEVNRLYEAYQKMIRTAGDLDQKAAQELGRTV